MINEIKDTIQRQGHITWINRGRQGTVAAGTGFGKSRLAVLEVSRMAEQEMLTGPEDILLVTPTTKLRDETWPDEFQKWGVSHLFDNHVKSICLASLKNEKGKYYKLVILDEIHRLTELSAQAFKDESEDALTSFFAEGLADAVMGLTATVPRSKDEPEKAAIIAQIAPVVFTYSLDQGVNDGIIADYAIRVIYLELNDVDKTYKAGTKAKPFMTTEQKAYNYMEAQIKRYQMLIGSTSDLKAKKKYEAMLFAKMMSRNRFLAMTESKEKIAIKCIRQLEKTGKRTLVFCGGIDQSHRLLGKDRVYHSKSGNAAFDAFNKQQLNILGVINAANEGINFYELDQELMVQIDSNSRTLTQRIGRCLRIREDHKAVLYILCTLGTVEERWLKKALVDFDQTKIKHYNAKMIPDEG